MARLHAPSSYGLVAPPQVDAMQNLSQLMALGSRMQDAETSSREANRAKSVEAAINTSKGNLEAAAGLLEQQGDWTSSRALRDRSTEIRTALVTKAGERLDQHKTIYGKSAQALKEIEARPELYADLRPQLVEMASALDPRFAHEIPEQYDPAQVRGMLQFVEGGAVQAETRTRALTAAKQALELQDKSNERRAAHRTMTGEWMSASGNQEDWDASLQGLRTMGVEDDVLGLVGPTWSKEAQEKARKLALTPAQQGVEARAAVDDERQAATAKRTAEHQTAMESIARQRESRLSTDDSDGGASRTQRATAERWKASELQALEQEFADPQKDLTIEEVRKRQLSIENSYRAQIGLSALPSLPREWTGQAARPPAGPPLPDTFRPAPEPVSSLLKGKKSGRYTLSDKSVWIVAADGTISKGS